MDQFLVIKLFVKLFFILAAILVIVYFFLKRIRGGSDDFDKAIPVWTAEENRRSRPRTSIGWKALIETSQGELEVKTKDVSLSGAFIVCETPLPIGEKLQIQFQVPTQNDLGKVNAEVVWSNVNVPADKIVNRGMGIRFIQNSNDVIEALRSAISYHL